VQLIAVVALVLFAPAGTLEYWQAWAFAAVFLTSALLVTAYLWNHDRSLLERRVRAGPGAESQPHQNVIQALAAIAFLGLMLVPAFDHRFGWSHVPAVVSVAADIAVGLGFLIIFRVFRTNSCAAGTIVVAAGQQVVTTGPYAVVRHPMYAGALVMLAAMPVALGSWWGLLMLVPMTLVLVWRLLDEERYLAEHLPGYGEYCRNVRRRLVPFLW
jgi:protein-S-isoprenylcysteine O-methyltransferase Ste14